MRLSRMLMLAMGLISVSTLSACSSMSGNVVPEKGPTMEKVYDSMDNMDSIEETDVSKNTNLKANVEEIKTQRSLPLTVASNTFHKIPNPELKMYVYPHLGGKDELPIPGYYTVFNAYTQDHYALPNEF